MLTHFSISQQGESHIASDKECQDRSGSVDVIHKATGRQVVLAVAADGVGSCLKGGAGADIAVKCVLRKLARDIQRCDALDDRTVGGLLQKTFQTACDVTALAADKACLPVSEYDTTLCVGVYDGQTLWFGQIGDSGMVAVYADGTYGLCTPLQKGEFANELIPLRARHDWAFGRAPKPVAAFAVMTDGVLNRVVGGPLYHHRVEYPVLIGPVLVDNRMATQDQARAMRAQWDRFLKGEGPYAAYGFRKRVRDDISLVAVQNPDLVAALPPIEFDYEAFDAQTRRVEQWRRDTLARFNQEFVARKNRERAHPAGAPAADAAPEQDGAGARPELAQCILEFGQAAARLTDVAVRGLLDWLDPPEADGFITPKDNGPAGSYNKSNPEETGRAPNQQT